MSENTPSTPLDPYDICRKESNKDACNLAMLAHISGLLGGVLGLGFLGIIGPLIIWQIKKNESPFVEDQAKEAINFQLSVLILAMILAVIAIVTCGFGIILFLAIPVIDIVFSVLAAIKASNGESYRYPMILRLVK